MTLAAHTIVGASIANILPNHPVIGFVAGFTSHFLLDAIPHWDYSLLSSKENSNNPMDRDMIINKYFIIDLLKIGIDISVGILAVLFLFSNSNIDFSWAPFWGMIGAIMPDALQFVYFKWRHEPLKSLQRFHIWVHGKNHNLSNYHNLRISSQIIVVSFFVIISKLFFS